MSEAKQTYIRCAAACFAVLAIGGLYFGAYAVADRRFSSAVQSADALEQQRRDGLWNYNDLSAREQYLYDLLSDAMESREAATSRTTFVPTQAEFSAAFDAVLCDYPLYCDLIRGECMLVAGDNSAYMTLSYLEDGVARRQSLSDFAESMTRDGLSLGLTESEFALVLNDMLTDRCRYATESLTAYSTAYDAVTGKTDSFGYALLYSLLCRDAGIDCAVVRGTVQAEDAVGEHAWNVLTLDGVTGYTDVMWNDTASSDAPQLPFHGYYFLSADEIGIDHTPMEGLYFPTDGETENYYEQKGVCITDAAALRTLLPRLMTDARSNTADAVEFWLDPTLDITDYALEEAITAAIDAANAAEGSASAPLLRHVHRLYRAAVGGGGITVQLFYEENNEQLGET